MFAEVDAGWVPYVKEQLDNRFRRSTTGPKARLTKLPSEYIDDHFWFTLFHEGRHERLAAGRHERAQRRVALLRLVPVDGAARGSVLRAISASASYTDSYTFQSTVQLSATERSICQCKKWAKREVVSGSPLVSMDSGYL